MVVQVFAHCYRCN